MILSLVLSRSSFDRMISERTPVTPSYAISSPQRGHGGWVLDGDWRTNTGSCFRIILKYLDHCRMVPDDWEP